MSNHSRHSVTAFGTIGGTLLSVFASVHTSDIVKTIVLANIGALVSFGISMVCKALLIKFKKTKAI